MPSSRFAVGRGSLFRLAASPSPILTAPFRTKTIVLWPAGISRSKCTPVLLMSTSHTSMGVKVLAGLNRGDVGTQLDARQHKIDTNRLTFHAPLVTVTVMVVVMVMVMVMVMVYELCCVHAFEKVHNMQGISRWSMMWSHVRSWVSR